jgi:hypothetical protein
MPILGDDAAPADLNQWASSVSTHVGASASSEVFPMFIARGFVNHDRLSQFRMALCRPTISMQNSGERIDEQEIDGHQF